MAGKEVSLYSYKNLTSYLVDSAVISDQGNFILNFSKVDYGMGYLSFEGKEFLVVLENEDIVLEGANLRNPETTQVVQGKENKIFAQYASEHPRREQALNAWNFLSLVYKNDSLFESFPEVKRFIETERQRIAAEDELFINSLDNQLYVKWYLPMRRLIISAANPQDFNKDERIEILQRLKDTDYADDRLYKSGLLQDIINSQLFLIENSQTPLDSVYSKINLLIDQLINTAVEKKGFEELIKYFFNTLEKRSLYPSSDYLANKVLNLRGIELSDKLKFKLESYRQMKVGKKAPNFQLKREIHAPAYEVLPQTLADIKAQYKVVIFGSSECPACPPELIQAAKLYSEWKKNDIEVIFVSLDNSAEVFRSFTRPFSFISICDLKEWTSPIVRNYHIYATPTIFLLDQDLKILLRPKSINHLNTWFQHYIK